MLIILDIQLNDEKMSRIFLNLFILRNSASKISSRQLSSFKGNFSSGRSSAYKWYALLSGTSLGVGYFALKSFKKNQIYALQHRKV